MKIFQPTASLTVFLNRRILLCLIPLIVLSTWLAFDSVRSLRQQQTREAEHLAQNMIADVDMFLYARIRGLQMLANSSLVDNPALWPLLHRQFQGFFKAFDSPVFLIEVTEAANILLHSQLPLGNTMPRPPPAAARAAVLAANSDRPVISDVFIGVLTHEPMIIIAVPAISSGPGFLVFVASVPTQHLDQYLKGFSLPDNWTVHLHDSEDATIACNTPETWGLDATAPQIGQFQVFSDLSDWSVFLGISQQAWQTPLLAAAIVLATGILFTTIIGLVIGRHASQRLNRHVKALTRAEKPAQNLTIIEFQKARLLLDDTLAGLRTQMQEADTARHKAEKALAELEQRNSTLEQFSYTISHDLRTPLVTIETFLGFLEKDLKTCDQSLVANDMAHIRTATRRMNVLLNDLGKLLMTKCNEPATVTDFNYLTNKVARLVAGPQKIRGVNLVITPCQLSLCASQNQLIQIWQNLIENAIKYMGDQAQPVIEIGVEQNLLEPVFYVRDNGIGIDKQYQQKIFGLFDQIDRNNPGSGLGLALVKHIVELYGGRIWVESEGAGQGSCFCFTLPAAIKQQGSA